MASSCSQEVLSSQSNPLVSQEDLDVHEEDTKTIGLKEEVGEEVSTDISDTDDRSVDGAETDESSSDDEPCRSACEVAAGVGEVPEVDVAEDATTVAYGSADSTSEDTLIIFDWDDTILPTTWLQQQGLSSSSKSPLPDHAQRVQLASLGRRAAGTLQLAKKLGQVVIVTNAEIGWVELSCSRFLPSLGESLRGVQVVSARSTYEKLGVKCPTEWKCCAFEQLVTDRRSSQGTGRRLNVVSIGDSFHEREALIHATGRTSLECSAKSVKLVERPCLRNIDGEHSILAGCLQQVVTHYGNLDLCIGQS